MRDGRRPGPHPGSSRAWGDRRPAIPCYAPCRPFSCQASIEPSERQRRKAEQVAAPHELARVDHDNHGPVYVANLHDPNTALGPARVRSFTLPATRHRRDRHDPVNRPRRDRWALTGQGSFESLGWSRMAWLDGKGIASPSPTGVGLTSAAGRTFRTRSTRAGAVEQPGSSGGAAGRNHTRPGPRLGGSELGNDSSEDSSTMSPEAGDTLEGASSSPVATSRGSSGASGRSSASRQVRGTPRRHGPRFGP